MYKMESHRDSWSPSRVGFLIAMTLVLLWTASQPAAGQAQPGPVAVLSAEQIMADPNILHQRLKVRNPGYNGQARFVSVPSLGLVGDFTGSKISDLSPLTGIPFNALDFRGQPISDLRPLQGMPLKLLGMEDTKVADLTQLKGMKLEKLYMNNAPINDLGPLAGMPLKELMLVGTKVKNLNALKGTPLQSLWLNGTPVRDISPLAGCPLVSLTLEGTKVADLRPLSKMTSLKRLHIGQTPVSDLTPLRDMKLDRLVFTPGNIKKGLDDVRNMKTLVEIGTTLEMLMPADDFWSRLEQEKKK